SSSCFAFIVLSCARQWRRDREHRPVRSNREERGLPRGYFMSNADAFRQILTQHVRPLCLTPQSTPAARFSRLVDGPRGARASPRATPARHLIVGVLTHRQ